MRSRPLRARSRHGQTATNEPTKRQIHPIQRHAVRSSVHASTHDETRPDTIPARDQTLSRDAAVRDCRTYHFTVTDHAWSQPIDCSPHFTASHHARTEFDERRDPIQARYSNRERMRYRIATARRKVISPTPHTRRLYTNKKNDTRIG